MFIVVSDCIKYIFTSFSTVFFCERECEREWCFIYFEFRSFRFIWLRIYKVSFYFYFFLILFLYYFVLATSDLRNQYS